MTLPLFSTYLRWLLPSALTLGFAASLATAAPESVELSLDLGQQGKEISSDLIGIFYEDLNYAADGGLYAELVQNRSFEYNALEQPDWTFLSFWDVSETGGAKGYLAVDAGMPVHPNDPHYAVLEVHQEGDEDASGVSIINPGFDGIPTQEGASYNLSFFAREAFTGNRWDGRIEGSLPLSVKIETEDGTVLGQASFDVDSADWKKYSAKLTASAAVENARLVVTATKRGGIALDEVSLFPEQTFHNHPNGLRPDLAQAIADLQPSFVRFPGGCLVHGNGVSNIYNWKDSIGPIEQRRQQPNLWGYHQTRGLGYYEYFQFCEDIGAFPLPIVAAGVSCQNSGRTAGHGQCGIPMEDMPEYVQDVLDLVEWANGPADSEWGAKRAAAGHPEPFGLKYIGVGNEDQITPEFRKRFKMIYDALQDAHPEITVIGTSGPFPDGEDFDKGWEFAREIDLPMVDEHYYRSIDWFWDNLGRYDSYDRNGPKVYLGEYAAHEPDRRNTLRSALAEAAYLTSVERNADVVHFASYAPLLAREGHTAWRPDMIYFTGTEVYRSANYYIQQLFSVNRGDRYLETKPAQPDLPERMAVSALRNTAKKEVVLKIVNGAGEQRSLSLNLSGAERLNRFATMTRFGGVDEEAENTLENPDTLVPETTKIDFSETPTFDLPAHSLLILRFRAE